MARETSTDPEFQSALSSIPAGTLGSRQPALATEASDPNDPRLTASVAWWGFDRNDSTPFIKAALASRATTLIFPEMNDDWVTKEGLIIERPGVTLLFQSGVVLKASGEDLAAADSRALIAMRNQTAVTIRGEEGYPALAKLRVTPRANEAAFSYPHNRPGAMGIRIDDCSRIEISSLHVHSDCADGMYFGDIGNGGTASHDVHLRHVHFNGNSRNGVSVISAYDVYFEECEFTNTGNSTFKKRPTVGIDFEPNNARQRIQNCVLKNCSFTNNNGGNISATNERLDIDSHAVSLQILGCRFGPINGYGNEMNSIRLIPKKSPPFSVVFQPSEHAGRAPLNAVNLLMEEAGPPVTYLISTGNEGVL